MNLLFLWLASQEAVFKKMPVVRTFPAPRPLYFFWDSFAFFPFAGLAKNLGCISQIFGFFTFYEVNSSFGLPHRN